ncbi:BQ5605_C025g10071 [Microbotryum silenes-dioicae]|uniref:BQ5605_C025g10071 protein n=1 Tax=Microbotryum silenes-dioicae TaxID=796604 RepID=A0A2X0PMN4_9BASI|nr:BQ5605_C025g10071 [Microbotryum silenes-dioicae]
MRITPLHPDTELAPKQELKGLLLPSGIQSDQARIIRDM